MSGARPHLLLVNVFFAPFSYGGATVVAEQVSQALVRRGWRVSAVSLISRAELAPYTVVRSQAGGIDNFLVNVPAGRSYVQMYDNPEVAAVLGALIDDLAPDLMQAHCIQEVGAAILDTAKARGLPVILSIHDFWWICERQFMLRVTEEYCGQNPVRIEACRGCVGNFDAARDRFEHLAGQGAKADLVTYPSRFARDLHEASGFAPGRGVVWENGVRLPGPDFAAARSARRAADPRPVFGFVGGPSALKGWPIIRDAFAGLEREDFRVIVVDGSLDGSWWAGVDLSGLPGDWQVHPRFGQGQMDAFYAQIDVLLFMSQWKETFGLTIREALARGIGVIQTDSGGTVEHGAADPKRLIPIGAGPDVLRPHLLAALDAHPSDPAPVTVKSFDDQAAEFERLAARVLQPE